MKDELLDTVIVLCFIIGIALFSIALYNQAELGFGNYLTFKTLESSIMMLCESIIITLGLISIGTGIGLYITYKKGNGDSK